jgi:DNA helicase II / ATP-dependent DNA helicase PcrA
MSNYLEQLNEVQRAAVTTIEGPVMVVAGPGSGKTRVLTYRIAHLLEKGIPPYQILSLTFTNKSAREMKERIVKVVGDKGNNVWAGTFHSVFARILRNEAEKIGLPRDFTIYDSEDSNSVINSIIKELNLDKAVYNTNTVKGKISLAKNNLLTPKLYAQNEELLAADRAAKRPYTYKIYQEYVNRCLKNGAMDFDDLLYRFFELLHKNPENVLEKYRARFRYILVDEFQDTNFLQYSILKKLVNYPGSTQNVCIVGDDAQSIYAFRGATIENILDFEKEFKNLKTFKLEQNYRSTNYIVQAANDVINHNKRQIKKEIWTDKAGGNKIKLVKTMTDNEEGKRVADMIMEYKNRNHLNNNEIAILYRTNAQSRVFEEFLRRYNIPYRIYGGTSFYQRKEVKDLLCYLRLIVNSRDEEALKRVLNYPRRGIGDSSLDKAAALAAQENISLWTALPMIEAGPASKKAILGFTTLIKTAIKRAETGTAYDIAYYVMKQSGILDDLKKDTTVEGLGRIENLNALLDGIKDFVENDVVLETDDENAMPMDKSLASYIQNIALVSDADQGDPNPDAVVLMSVHSAKGLEFKAVFVVGLEENLFPSFMSMDNPDGLDEERRLFYVAITRAEAFLTLTYSQSRYRFGQMKYSEPSRFLDEINAMNFEGASAYSRSDGDNSAPTSKVSGNFKPLFRPIASAIKIDPTKFKPSPSNDIKAGQKVLHLKFGEGKVINVEGSIDNRMATIEFPEADEPTKRIMLKFAKLEIVE